MIEINLSFYYAYAHQTRNKIESFPKMYCLMSLKSAGDSNFSPGGGPLGQNISYDLYG